METQKLNIFIVDDDKLMDMSLKHYLENRFGSNVNVSVFYDGESCLEKLDKTTNIVILDYFLDGVNKFAKNGLEILRSIKKINPKTEVIMLSNNADMGVAIESFREGASDYIVKDNNAFSKLLSLIVEPIKKLVAEFGVPKFLIIFLSTFLAMGAIVYWVMKLIS